MSAPRWPYRRWMLSVLVVVAFIAVAWFAGGLLARGLVAGGAHGEIVTQLASPAAARMGAAAPAVLAGPDPAVP